MRKKRITRPRVRRVVVVIPSLFTLTNLFFGIWAIVLAAQGNFYLAGWWIVIAGVLDMLDGLSARVSRTGSAFGAELDSLVDIVSFGVAPAVLLYHLILADQGPFAWIFCFAYVMCVALRLARFNSQDSQPAAAFVGLPSPAAGMTIATYYPFTQTTYYQAVLADWPWPEMVIFLVIALSLAMVSNVQYAKLPRIGVRTVSGIIGLGVHLTIISFAIWSRDIFFFPFGLAYVAYGVLRWSALAFLEREGEEDADEDPDLILHDTDDRAAGQDQ